MDKSKYNIHTPFKNDYEMKQNNASNANYAMVHATLHSKTHAWMPNTRRQTELNTHTKRMDNNHITNKKYETIHGIVKDDSEEIQIIWEWEEVGVGTKKT